MMTKINEKAIPALLKFIEQSGITEEDGYQEPTIIRTTKWGADQFGWEAICSVCKGKSCIYNIRQDNQGFNIPRCRHSNGTTTMLYATNPCIARHQSR
jgi:hypothetical protein